MGNASLKKNIINCSLFFIIITCCNFPIQSSMCFLPFNFIYRYDSSSGTFTVPSGGDGFYFFSVYLLGDDEEYGYFDIQINGEILCTVRVDQQQSIIDYPQSACSAAIHAAEGR